jgi:hypothetical protein
MKHWRTVALLGVLWIAPPALVSLVSIVSGLPAVLETGLCPPAPPDIPAYPCTAIEYVARMAVGPWALMGHLAVVLVWTVFLGSVLSIVAVWRLRRRRKPAMNSGG